MVQRKKESIRMARREQAENAKEQLRRQEAEEMTKIEHAENEIARLIAEEGIE